MNSIISEMLGLSGMELIAAVLALAYVWLAARQSILCWPCALSSSSIYVWVFANADLPYQAVLNFYYVMMALYGWLTWYKIQGNETASLVKQLSLKWHVIAVTMLAMLTFTIVEYMHIDTAQSFKLYLDAGVAVFSVFTTFLVTQKYVENWLYWIVINSAAAYLYFGQGLYFTTILFAIYIVMSVYGLLIWRESLHSSQAYNASV